MPSILEDVLSQMSGEAPAAEQPAQPAQQQPQAAPPPVEKKKLFGYSKDWSEEYPKKG